MRSDHPNAKIYREISTAIKEGPDGLDQYLTDDVVWHEVDNPQAIHGKHAVLEAVRAFSDQASIDYELYDVLADDDLVVGYGHATLRAGERSGAYDAIDIARMRDGKVAERWAMVNDRAAMHEFWDGL